jgi:transposase
VGQTISLSLAATEQNREDVRAARERWVGQQPRWDPARLVFIDETGLTTAMTRRYGWGPEGERVRGTAPAGHWQTTTFVAALRQGGLTVPMLTEGPMTGALFKAYVKTFLAPTLSAGDIVVCDNLSSHLVAGVKEAIEARGASFKPLPPYSPDFNPIEAFFAKLKAGLRRAEARTLDALEQAVAALLDGLTPAECQGYFRGAGYPSQAI